MHIFSLPCLYGMYSRVGHGENRRHSTNHGKISICDARHCSEFDDALPSEARSIAKSTKTGVRTVNKNLMRFDGACGCPEHIVLESPC